MSTPQLLAETDAKMIQELNTLGYFKYIFLTVFGKGFWDHIVTPEIQQFFLSFRIVFVDEDSYCFSYSIFAVA